MNRKTLQHLVNNIKWAIKLMRGFGFVYGMGYCIVRLAPRRVKVIDQLCEKVEFKCDQFAMTYLKKKYEHIIDNYNYIENADYIGEDSNIWVFWYQGEKNAPEIVKTCISSIKRNAGEHSVVLLDKDNYMQYASLPDYIIEKFEKGVITVTHFSDLLRTELLWSKGGIWMDATMYMMHPLEQQISNRTFFTMNRTEKIYSKNAPPEMKLGHWTSFFLAAGKGNSIIGILRALFYEYWREENAMIVYLLIDYFLIMIYENVEKAAALINNLPISNRNTWGLLQIINEEYSQLETLKKDGTYLYKLTYKIKFNNQINGKETVYHWLVNQGERIGVAE